jgi:hypothetical protein
VYTGGGLVAQELFGAAVVLAVLLRAPMLFTGADVGTCVLGLVVPLLLASDEAGGASLFHIFIGFHT